MAKHTPDRHSIVALCAALFLVPAAFGQLSFGGKPSAGTPMPAAQPTQLVPAPPAAAPIEPAPHAYRARIEFTGGQLTVSADNSSLDQILSDIAQITKMKITGGVADERVYGTYGPDSPQAVLTALLDGSGTNLLLLESPQHTVQELILTARNGGPTPPTINPSRSYDRDSSDLPPMPAGRRGRGEFNERRFAGDAQNIRGGYQQPNPQNPNFQPQITSPTPPPVQPTPETTTEQSPNGVKTPQQIFQELMQQRQQQQQIPPPQ
jgi:hypothetical protein